MSRNPFLPPSFRDSREYIHTVDIFLLLLIELNLYDQQEYMSRISTNEIILYYDRVKGETDDDI